MKRLQLMPIAVFLLAFCLQSFARDVTIMPLGDSITEGGAYRRALWKLMVDDGHKVEFMGTGNNGKAETYKGQTWDGDHESVWGISSGALLGKLKGDLKKTQDAHGGKLVEVVLYHIGTNDINTGNREQGEKNVDSRTIPTMEETIEVLRRHNPDIAVLVCRILPIKNSQTVRMGLVDYLNKKIELLAKRLTTKRSPVIVVDQNTGFDATKGVDTYDGMHPNGQGGVKMAKQFYKGIKQYWATRVQTIIVDTENAVVRENGKAVVPVRLSMAIPAGRKLVVKAKVVKGDRDIRIEQGAQLTFNSGNWKKSQNVVLTAADDADEENGKTTIRFTSVAPIEACEIKAVEDDDDHRGPKPILWWTLDDKSGPVQDSSNNGMQGKGAGKLTRGVDGKVGKAFAFKENAYIRVAPATADKAKALEFAGKQMTLAAWIHPVNHGNGQWQGIFGASNWRAPCLSLKGEGILMFGIVGAADPMNGGKISLGKWTHIAMTFDDAKSRLRYYVNGKPTGAAIPYGAKIGKGQTIPFIGKRAWENQHYFNGKIDDVRIYGSILTPAEILQIYKGRGQVETK